MRNWILRQANALPVFLLNDEQAAGTQTSVIEFAYVLHFVEAELHSTALALTE